MDYEVHVWPFVPFEYDPVIATLLVLLSTHFLSLPLSFDLRRFNKIHPALTLAAFAPNNNQSSPHFCVITEPIAGPPPNHVLSSRPCSLGQELAMLVFHQALNHKGWKSQRLLYRTLLYICHQIYLTTWNLPRRFNLTTAKNMGADVGIEPRIQVMNLMSYR